MKSAAILLFHLLSALAKLIRPGGSKAIIAENALLRQQLIVHGRSRQRAPNLTVYDRLLLGFLATFLNPRRISRLSIIIRPSTLLKFHAALVQRKYRNLFTPTGGKKPGPKGPSQEVVSAIVEMKQRNPRFGCPRIAQQINLAFGLALDKDVIRRVLANHYKPVSGDDGPTWLTTLGHTKDSLWSIDLFRCESIVLRSHWVLVVMDQFTRRIVGFAVHPGPIDGKTLCRMFSQATMDQCWPTYLSSDNDPLFQYHRWKANLRILEIEEVKSIPYAPMSHPYVERLIGSVRCELLDQTLFWTAADLEKKLRDYQSYFNEQRTHTARCGATPVESIARKIANFGGYRWESHCRGLFSLPIAA